MVSSTWYSGNDMDMLLPSCFFTMGAAAMLLYSCMLDRWRSKYEMKRLVQTHQGVDNRSFKSMHLKEDAEGRQGLSVSKDLVETGGHALKANITTLGPLVLPVSEQIHFFTNLLFKKKTRPYIPAKNPQSPVINSIIMTLVLHHFQCQVIQSSTHCVSLTP